MSMYSGTQSLVFRRAWENFIEKYPNISEIWTYGCLYTKNNWAVLNAFAPAVWLFAAPWSSKLLATLYMETGSVGIKERNSHRMCVYWHRICVT